MKQNSSPQPERGDIWSICFDPTKGAEIQKIRPAVVISVNAIGRLPLRIVIPITGWNDNYRKQPWMIKLSTTEQNGLSKLSAADCFQVKSVSLERFEEKLGTVTQADIDEMSAAVALCVGFSN